MFLWSGAGAGPILSFPMFLFVGEEDESAFVLCVVWVFLFVFFSNICNKYSYLYIFHSIIPLPYLWYVWVENIKNQSWSVTRILDQCRFLFILISALLRIFVELHSASHGDSGNRPVPWTCDWRVPHYAKDFLLKGVFEAVPRALPLQRPHICKFVER